MDARLTAIAQRCLDSAAGDTMTFPQIVGTLSEAGFERYVVDLQRGVVTYSLADGESVELRSATPHGPVAAAFDAAAIQAAIREAQTLAPGYTYEGFCAKVTAAGCAGYQVSFLGRRAVYYGRTAETHVELFPSAQ